MINRKCISFVQLAPCRNIFGIGRNYEEHAKELGNPVPKGEPIVFLKASSSFRPLASKSGEFSYPKGIHAEAEIVLGFSKSLPRGHRTSWEDISCIALGLDMTNREKQNELKSKGLPWTLAKSFAGASILSPFLHSAGVDWQSNLSFSFEVNNQLKQTGNSKDMIFGFLELTNFILESHAIHSGDLVFTGTPAGVGPVSTGDKLCLSWLDDKGIKILSFEGVL